MIYPSLASITFKELEVEQIIDICVKNGVKAVEWASDPHVPQGDALKAQRLKKTCEDNNIKIAAYDTYFVLGRDADEIFEELLVTAKELGAKLVRVWGSHEPTNTMSASRRAELIAQANRIADMAQQENILLTYEYHHNSLTDTVESTLDLLASTHNTKTHWQKPIGMKEQECIEQIKTLKNEITNLHVNSRCATSWHYNPLKTIKNEWISYLYELCDRGGDDIYACIEFTENSSVEQFEEDFEVLKSILAEIYKGK